MKAIHEAPTSGFSLGGMAGRALELRELRYFHSVARTGNFGRAARELNITQPAVTLQVRKLEEELGTPLLIRHGRGVTLTRAGAALMERVEQVMSLLSAPLDAAETPDTASGLLTLGVPSESAPLLVPPLIERCRAVCPSITLAIREGTSASLEEWLIDQRVDVALVQDPPALDELEIEPLVEEPLGLVSGTRRPLGNVSGPVRMRQLGGLPLVLPHPRHWIRRRVEQAAFRCGLTLNVVQQLDSVPLIREMVRSGLGCSVLPFAAVRDEVARGSLAFHPFGHEPLFTVHALAWRRAAQAPSMIGFRRFLRDAVSEFALSGVWAGVGLATGSARAAKPEAADAEAAIA
jgi:LysR family nitrogen assimilation transcriptional regulator